MIDDLYNAVADAIGAVDRYFYGTAHRFMDASVPSWTMFTVKMRDGMLRIYITARPAVHRDFNLGDPDLMDLMSFAVVDMPYD